MDLIHNHSSLSIFIIVLLHGALCLASTLPPSAEEIEVPPGKELLGKKGSLFYSIYFNE